MIRLALVALLLASPVQAQQTATADTDAIIDTGRLATCLRRPHDDPHHCIGIAAKACYDQPSSAPNAIRAAERCDLAELNFWQTLLNVNAARLTQSLRGASFVAFQRQQNLWEQATELCDFPFASLEAPLWPEGEATRCNLHRVADRALQLGSYVTDYLDYCEFPARDMQPGTQCKP